MSSLHVYSPASISFTISASSPGSSELIAVPFAGIDSTRSISYRPLLVSFYTIFYLLLLASM